MPGDYFPLLILIVVAIAFAAIALIVSAMAGPRRPTLTKQQTYESGMPVIGTARQRVFIRYYLVAVLFILFDIEIIFFYPWAVVFRSLGLGLFALVEMIIFVAILLVGYVYIWKKGGFDWQ